MTHGKMVNPITPRLPFIWRCFGTDSWLQGCGSTLTVAARVKTVWKSPRTKTSEARAEERTNGVLNSQEYSPLG